jgi:DNA-binding LacI/PurR family transcriptional regulator/GAF domain-containing protein
MVDQEQSRNSAMTEPEERGVQATLGMLVVSLSDRYNTMLVQGAADFAASRGLKLVVYLLDGPDAGEAQDNVVSDISETPYARVNAQFCDGLMLTGALAYRDARGVERLNAFRARHPSLPMVGISLWLDDMPTVVPDSYGGLREAIEHLIDHHGYERIGFIGGPPDSVEAKERYRAYKDGMAARGLTPEPTWIVEGDFSRESGLRAARTLLRRGLLPTSKPDGEEAGAAQRPEGEGDGASARNVLDAVVCASDNTAIGVMEVLASEGLRVPDDVALLGFDDIAVASRLPVPLSTVRQPVHQIGYQAAAHLWARVQDKPVDDDELSQMVVPTHFVPRRSCGCLPSLLRTVQVVEATVAQDALSDLEGADLPAEPAKIYARYREGLVRALWGAVRQGDSVLPAPELLSRREVEHLLDALWDDLQKPMDDQSGDGFTVPGASWEAGSFLRLLNRFLPRAVEHYGANLLGWQRAISMLRHRLRVLLSGKPSLWLRAEDLLQQARALVSDAQLRGFAYQQTLSDRHLATLQDFSGRAMNLMELDALLPLMEDLLPQLDLTACHLLLHAGAGQLDRAYPLLSYRAGQARLHEGAAVQPLAHLLSASLSQELQAEPSEAGAVQIVMELRVGDQNLGLVHFAGDLMEAGLYQRLRQVLSGVIFRSQLSKAQRARAARLAAAAEVSSATTSITDLANLLPEAVTLIKDRFDLYYAGLFLVDNARRWAVLVAGTGAAGREMLDRGHKLAVGGQSMIGACVATGDARIVFDVNDEVARRSNPLLPETQSELALPLISRGNVIGAMTIQDVRPNAFDEEDITALQTMANQLANAIENARLLEQMERTVQDLQRATQEYTEDTWREFVRNRAQALGYRYHLLDVEPADDPHPEAREALTNGKPVVSVTSALARGRDDGDGAAALPAGAPPGEEVEGGQAGLGVPIRLRNQILGVLNLRFEEGHVPEETIQMVEQVADRLAVSLESARLLEESQRAAQREHLIAEVSSRIRQTLEVDEVLRTSVREIRNAMDLFKVSVRLAPRTDGARTSSVPSNSPDEPDHGGVRAHGASREGGDDA